MGHHHGHEHNHGRQNIKVAFLLNFIFTIIEIAGGIFTNSIAILSDALHDLGDTLSLGLAWYFEKLSGKGRDATYSYGYKRFSLLGALINAVILLVGSIFILTEAIPRLLNPEETNAEGMILLAILGIIFNGVAVFKLKKDKNSINQKMVALHLMEDVLGWIAVLVSGVIMYFFNLPIIDPILSLLISAFIIWNVIKNLRKTLQIILQGMPGTTEIDLIKDYLNNIEAVSNFHDFHIWSMDGEYNIMTIHLVPKNEISLKELEGIKSKIKADLLTQGVDHVTIEFDLAEEDCELADC